MSGCLRASSIRSFRFCGRRIRHQQDFADLRHHRDRRKILFTVVRQAGVERGIGRMARKHHQQGVAVGVGHRGRPCSDRAAGARAVLDHDRLAELIGNALADQPRQNIGYAARAGRHDHPDRAGGIVLRRCRGCESDRKADQEPRPLPSGSSHQFTSILLSAMTFCHLARSSASNLLSSSGVLCRASSPMPLKVARSWGSASA